MKMKLSLYYMPCINKPDEKPVIISEMLENKLSRQIKNILPSDTNV